MVFVIVDDFYIDCLNTNGSEQRQFCNLLESFGFVQNVSIESYGSYNLLHYIIIRKDWNIMSEFTISDFISEHMTLYCNVYVPTQFEKS